MKVLLDECLPRKLKFDELAAPVNCMARSELGFPIDQEKYLAMLGAASSRQREMVGRWKVDWHVRYQDHIKQSPFDVELPVGRR
jgi:hypothetical protein